MKTITINLYQFKELSKEGQQKALEVNSWINVDYEWWNCTYDDAETVGLKIIGFDIHRGTIDLSTSQGLEYSVKEILNNHGEECETYKTAKYFNDAIKAINKRHFNGEKSHIVENGKEYDFDEEKEKLERLFESSIGRQYLRMLRTEHDYMISDKAIIETFEANEYHFTNEGEIKNC